MLTIVYVSAATPLCDEAQLAAILQKSRANNARTGITGLLVHIDGNFMQALEGPDEEVKALAGRIAGDPRHTRVITLLQETIEERAFANWAMDYRGGADLAPEHAAATRTVIADVPDANADDDGPTTNALRLIASFRRSMR